MAILGMIGGIWKILRRPIGWCPRPVRRTQPPDLSIVLSSSVGAPLRPSDVFTPTQPRGGRNTLIGRQEEIEHILQALVEDRAHVVLYSERGRGKTSLSNNVLDRLRSYDQSVARYQCDASSEVDGREGSNRRSGRSKKSFVGGSYDANGRAVRWSRIPVHAPRKSINREGFDPADRFCKYNG